VEGVYYPPGSAASLSMRNLHKLYEPPIPKHLIPTNNPFYNKQIFSPSAIAENLGLNLNVRISEINGVSSSLLQNSEHGRVK
jgi:hypothetical protein